MLNNTVICRICGIEKDSFYVSKKGKVCVDCSIERSKNYYKEHRDKILGNAKEKRKERFLKELQRKYKNKSLERLVYEPVYIKPGPVNENMIKIDQQICEYFGCGKTLSRTEKLFGNYCTGHNGIGFQKTIFNNGKL